MKAKSKEQYIEAWTSHINQFIHVCMDAEMPIEGWTELKEDMQTIIDVAANKSFPEEEWKELWQPENTDTEISVTGNQLKDLEPIK